MNSNRPFLVGCGNLSECSMKAGAIALIDAWGGDLKEFSINESPYETLNNLTKEEGLILLSGDAAVCLPEGGSWLEALGAWKQPVILLVSPCPSGVIPGSARAYVALCKELSVPLIGLLQLGGSTEGLNTFRDQLPWCGWLPDSEIKNESGGNLDDRLHEMDIDAVVDNLRIRCFHLAY